MRFAQYTALLLFCFSGTRAFFLTPCASCTCTSSSKYKHKQPYLASANKHNPVNHPRTLTVCVAAHSESSLYNDTLASLTGNTMPATTTARSAVAVTVPGPPVETRPDYENQIGPLGKWMDTLFLVVFRRKLAEQVGEPDSSQPWTAYAGITELASRMNQQVADRREIQRRSQETLRALFPSWLPKQYAILFSKPFPAFSARMNAWATWVAGTWLMGECEVNDVIVDGDVLGKDQGLLVKRCRFLEESQCASVCVNSCKIPTQNFFIQDMGLPLTMEPNYETFECQFSFGKTPNVETELLAKSTPCLMQCPANGALRKFHDKGSQDSSQRVKESTSGPVTACGLMESDD